RGRFVTFGAFVAIMFSFVVFGLPRLVPWLERNGVPILLSQVGGYLGTLAALLAPYMPKARRALDVVKGINTKQEQLIEAEKKKRKSALSAELSQLPERIKL